MITNSKVNGKWYRVKLYTTNRNAYLRAFKKYKHLISFDHNIRLFMSYDDFREVSSSKYWLTFIFKCKNCKYEYRSSINRYGRNRRSNVDARIEMREILTSEMYENLDPRLKICCQHDRYLDVINVMKS